MIKMYKGDKECTCDKDQVKLMEMAGWSKVKEQSKPTAKKFSSDVKSPSKSD